MTTVAEIEPRFLSEIEEGQRLRGWIKNAYAQIEFLLGDFILRCNGLPEYSHLPSTLPHGAPDRVKRVRRILAATGPMQRFDQSLRPLLEEFERGQETRNLLAHGFCEYLYTPSGDTGLQFQKWHRQPDREDARLIRCFRIEDMRREKEAFSRLAQRGLELFMIIHEHFGWVARPDK